MVDITEAADALVIAIAAGVYPSGTAAPSVIAAPVIVYQGWPEPQTLKDDLAAGKAHISVFPRPGGKVTHVMMGDSDWAEQSNDGVAGIGALEVRRQTRILQITFWSGTPQQRDALAKAIDGFLAFTPRIAMPDGTQAILTSASEVQVDAQQKSGVYRRDLLYVIDYATLHTEAQFNILHTITNTTAGPTLDASGPTITTTRP